MKINKKPNIFFPMINTDKAINKGNILIGKIVEIKGKSILLDIKGLGIIKASSEIDLKEYINKEATFVVESSNEKVIKIKPNVEENNKELNSNNLYKKEEYVESVLKKFNIKRTQFNTQLIKSLMEYGVKLDEDSIIIGVNLLDKLKNVIDLNDEKVYIGNDIEYINTVGNSIGEDIYTLDSDFISHLKYMIKDNEVNLLPKTIAFFIKYSIKPSLSNIRNFIELNVDIENFSKDYEILKKFIDKEFTNHPKNIIIGNGSSKNPIEESNASYFKYADKILKYFRYGNIKNNKEISKVFERFQSKLELIKELNNVLTFLYLPIDISRDIDSIITLIKKKRNKYEINEAINVFITLNTINLGKINILCRVSNSNMRIEFGNLKRENIDFIKSREEELKEMVNLTGYEITSIDYEDQNDFTVLDILTVNANPLYCLDVKV